MINQFKNQISTCEILIICFIFRSRKAQQEAKSKDHQSSNSNSSEEKPRERPTPPAQPPAPTTIPTFNIAKSVINDKVITNLTNNNNFHFSKQSLDQHPHLPPHAQSMSQRHLNIMNGNSKDFITNGIDENNTNNILNRQQTLLFNENSQNDDMIWRVV